MNHETTMMFNEQLLKKNLNIGHTLNDQVTYWPHILYSNILSNDNAPFTTMPIPKRAMSHSLMSPSLVLLHPFIVLVYAAHHFAKPTGGQNIFSLIFIVQLGL